MAEDSDNADHETAEAVATAAVEDMVDNEVVLQKAEDTDNVKAAAVVTVDNEIQIAEDQKAIGSDNDPDNEVMVIRADKDRLV